MSLIIKGLDMPKKGERYNIILLDDGSVTTFKLDNKRVYESFKNNPLEKHEAIQIERPHGRLIDGDDFIDVCEMLADKNDDRRPFEQAEWIAKDFLHKMSRAVPVRIFDLDATPGNNLKEDEAGALLLAHRFDYNSEVIDFYIYHDNVTIYIKRQQEDKK